MQHRPQVTARRRELVEVSTPVFGVGPAFEDAVLHEPAEPIGEDGFGHVEVGLQVVEAPHAVESVADDQQRPPLADHLQRAGERAVLVLVAVPEHVASVADPGSVIELIR